VLFLSPPRHFPPQFAQTRRESEARLRSVLGYDDATTSALRLSGFLLHYAPRKLVLTRTLEAVTLPGQGLSGAFLERFTTE
jgi:hypothetical protein